MLDTNAGFLAGKDELPNRLREDREATLPPNGGKTDLLLPDLHWQPFLSTFGPEIAAQFTWAVTTDTIETYEHCETSRFLHIDSVTLECLNQNCEVISSESALRHALRPGARPVLDVVKEIVAVESTHQGDAIGVLEPMEVAPLEPELTRFVRTMKQIPETANSFVASAESPGQVAAGSLDKVLRQTKRLWLGSFLSWSDPLISRAQETAGIQAQISHEPNFAPFTRRSTAS